MQLEHTYFNMDVCMCVLCLAGGCMRMTVATCVMLLELTNNLALLPLMMLVTLVAKVRERLTTHTCKMHAVGATNIPLAVGPVGCP